MDLLLIIPSIFVFFSTKFSYSLQQKLMKKKCNYVSAAEVSRFILGAISGEKPNIHPLQCDFFFKINIELESPIAPTFISSIMREYISVHSNCTYLPIKSMGTYSVVSHVFGSYLISYLQFF